MSVTFHPHNPIEALESLIVKADGTPLQGEIDIYRKIYEDLNSSNETWHVWHDIKLPIHSNDFNYYKKTSAQIDFLILWKKGILVIEVKGGFISTKNNTFYYGKNFESEMSQNPFRQAEGYKYTLKDNILNNIKGCFFCEAVAFPHVNYAFQSKLIDDKLLWTQYNSSQYNDSFEKFILNVFSYTLNKHKQHFRVYPELDQNHINSVIKVLSPIIQDRNRFNSIDTLKWLNINNIDILNGLYKNQRIMIEGPPGSGKTTIAKAYIDRQFGKKGLFICWNNLLMNYTKKVLKERCTLEDIEVTTFSRFLLKYNPQITYEVLLNAKEFEFYELMKSTIENLKKNNNVAPYDFIVVDEGQDIFDRGLDLFINKFSGYNNQGLKNGNILVLYDIDQSYSLSGRSVIDLAEILREYFTHYRLNENKRSAQNPDIRKLASEVLHSPQILNEVNFSVEFPNITICKQRTLLDVKNHLVNSVLKSIRSKDSSLRGEDCVILIESTLLKGEYNNKPDLRYELTIKDIEELNEDNILDTSNKLRYTTILKYKGLEKKNVFLITTTPNYNNIYEIYIGITRAIYNLEIIVVQE